MNKLKRNRAEHRVGKKLRGVLQHTWGMAKNKFAAYLSEKTNGVPASRLKKYLFLFCAVCITVSTGIFIYPFLSPTISPLIATQKIRFPVHPYSEQQVVLKDSLISYHKYQKIILLEKRLYRMKTSQEGKSEYDSLMKIYPGLQDSIQLLKQLYQNQ